MVNKRGWLRVLEAAIGVLLVFGVMLFLSGMQKASGERDLTAQLAPMLEELATNASIRERVILQDAAANEAMIDAFLRERITDPTLAYRVKVCAVEESCHITQSMTQHTGSVYTAQRIISASTSEYLPKKIHIALWRTRRN